MIPFYQPVKALLAGVMLLISPALCADARATNVLNDSFDSYSAGNLAGQGSWVAIRSDLTKPIQVANPSGNTGYVTLGTSGQGAYKAFSSIVSNSGGNSLTTTFSLTLSNAPSSGDYFAYLVPDVSSANRLERIYAVATTGGYLLGISGDGGTSATYGVTTLSFGTAVSVSVTWNFVDGPKNDTFTLKVDGSTYASQSWMFGDEPTMLAAFNLRQGVQTTTPSISSFDNLSIDSISPVPEPATILSGVLLVGALGWNQRRRLNRLARSLRQAHTLT